MTDQQPEMPEIPAPHSKGLTPEAAEALRNQGLDVTDSDLADLDAIPETDEPFLGFATLGEDSSTGDTIPDVSPDIKEDVSVAIRSRGTRGKHSAPDADEPREAKSGPPSLDEWSRFLSRVVLRTACDWYMNWAFRGVDENLLTDRDLERLQLTDDEKKLIAVPFAELAHKSKFMKKHGRSIVASGDAFNAIVVIGAWASRVNRIASRYKPSKGQHGKVTINGRSRSSETPPSQAGYYEGANGGRVNFGNGVVPGSS